MFIYTISDIVGLVIVVILAAITAFLYAIAFIDKWRRRWWSKK